MDDYEFSLRHMRRCVVNCPPKTDPCPVCAEDEECIITSQSCDACAKPVCVKSEASSSTNDGGSSGGDDGGGTNVGAIAGGVIGGIALLVALGLIWWFFFAKKRRQAAADNAESFYPDGSEKRDTYATNPRTGRSRVGSMASTVLTRASNVIPIAYIPGVTNRSPPDSPAVLVPPVPPIPGSGASTSEHSQAYGGPDQHYFLPGDIRDSVWSQMTEDQRKSISPSLARSSVATTIYRNNAIVSPVPAQQALRAKPAMVSVKSGQNSPTSTPGTQTPAVPAITDSQMDKAHAVGEKLENFKSGSTTASPIVARSGFAKPVNVTKPKSKQTPTTTTNTENNSDKSVPTVTVDDTSENSKGKEKADDVSDIPIMQSTQAGHQRALRQGSSASGASGTVIEDSPAVKQSPFADPSSSPPQSQKPQSPTPTQRERDAVSPISGSSSAIPEEMSRNPSPQIVESRRGSGSHSQSQSQSHHRHRSSQSTNRLSRKAGESGGTDAAKRSQSPFSDANEVK